MPTDEPTAQATDDSIDDSIDDERARAVAAEAYTFFFPMLMGYRYLFASFLEPRLPGYRGPLNEMHGSAATLDHTFREVVSPNADTPYSMAALDLRAEPVVLEVPAVPDRYYVMQFVDLWGHNPHYVGTRTTGPGPGRYAVVGPGHSGEVADGLDGVLRCETDVVMVIGRTQLLGPDDLQPCAAVMDGYTIRPLSEVTGSRPAAPPEPAVPPLDLPPWDDEASRDERFIAYVNALLPLCQPPHPDDLGPLGRFSAIGIGPGAPFAAGALDEGTRAALRAGVADARAAVEAKAADIGRKVNGWSATEALGSREFFAGDALLRAAGAMAGWGGNDKVEAFYPLCREDSEGRPLDGSHAYTLTLVEDPPAKAFWSVTMYDTSYDGVGGYLVENPIGRYLVNSTTPGLSRGPDGSLTVHVQHDRPGTAEAEANWLPAPEGAFYLVMRLYWPEDAALDGTWQPTPVTRRT
jgi:hypothetical protein